MDRNNNKYNFIFSWAGKQENMPSDREYWLSKTVMERLEAAWIQSCYMYGIGPYNLPDIEEYKKGFSMRKQNHG